MCPINQMRDFLPRQIILVNENVVLYKFANESIKSHRDISGIIGTFCTSYQPTKKIQTLNEWKKIRCFKILWSPIIKTLTSIIQLSLPCENSWVPPYWGCQKKKKSRDSACVRFSFPYRLSLRAERQQCFSKSVTK